MAMEFAARDFSKVRGLKGIADGVIQAHLKLYEGYVTNTNVLNQKLAQHKPGTPEWAEMKRRLGFELNGIVLHEYYFEALAPGGVEASKSVKEALAAEWSSIEAWREEFVAMGKMRGIGWVITYRNPATRKLSNHWIELHHHNHPAGWTPIVVMDVWEHAYSGMERPAYIEAWLANHDWSLVEQRLAAKG
ncbi:MAG: superoxide dismutase [Planctomycetes bacterium]|nr:superoxide dismutase [Planctomycetota bacterium]